MDRYRARPEADAITFEASRGSKRLAVLILVPILLVASIAVLRASGVTTRPSIFLTGAAKDMAPAELASTAADAFELATAVGGPGYTFEVVQHATLVARSEGPPIDDPDPASPEKAAETGSQVAGSYIERGTATPDGFHAEIRRGPDDPRAPPDWTANDLELAALVRGGKTYRNDGAGWYATTRPPGLGLDPATADLLPTMLRQLTDPTDVTAPEPDASVSPDSGRAKTDPFAHLSPSRRLEGHTKIADIPGIIAVDLADATELRGPAELAFDDAGRLVGLRVLARNANLETYDLLIETVISFAYPAIAPDLPKPEPVWSPKDGGSAR